MLLLLPERELQHADPEKRPRPPWRIFATNPTLISMYFNHGALAFVVYTIALEIPKFLDKVLHPPPGITTAIDTLPLGVGIFSAFLFSVPTDMLLARGVEATLVRRTNQAIALLLPAALLPLVSLGSWWALMVFTACAVFGAASSAGVYSAYLDVCQRWSGQIFAMGNTVCAVCASLTPLIVQALVNSFSDAKGYQVRRTRPGPAARSPTPTPVAPAARAPSADGRRAFDPRHRSRSGCSVPARACRLSSRSGPCTGPPG